jgi:hypothetical protein
MYVIYFGNTKKMSIPSHRKVEILALYRSFNFEEESPTKRKRAFKNALRAYHGWASPEELEIWYKIVEPDEKKIVCNKTCEEILKIHPVQVFTSSEVGNILSKNTRIQYNKKQLIDKISSLSSPQKIKAQSNLSKILNRKKETDTREKTNRLECLFNKSYTDGSQPSLLSLNSPNTVKSHLQKSFASHHSS